MQRAELAARDARIRELAVERDALRAEVERLRAFRDAAIDGINDACGERPAWGIVAFKLRKALAILEADHADH